MSFQCACHWLWRLPTCIMLADDDEDVKVFRKIRQGRCDVDDPIWQKISAPAKDLVVWPSNAPDSALALSMYTPLAAHAPLAWRPSIAG